MIMDKNLLSVPKTTTHFSATPLSDTNKATLQHSLTELSTQTPTKYIACITKIITLS